MKNKRRGLIAISSGRLFSQERKATGVCFFPADNKPKELGVEETTTVGAEGNCLSTKEDRRASGLLCCRLIARGRLIRGVF